MAHSRSAALIRARASTTNAVGMCLQWTRTQFGIPAGGDWDGDGDADAVDAWKRAKKRHPDDRNPPAGVPVYWTGGRRGHGHVAVSEGGGRVRSTDWPTPGRVGTVGIDTLTAKWGLPYAGWSEDLNGITIPNPNPPKPTSRGRRVDAALTLLRAALGAKPNPTKARRIRAAVTALEQIKPK